MISKEQKSLQQNGSDYYDSGLLMSSESISVPYTGKALNYATRYFIQIAVQYENAPKLYYSDIIPVITEMAPQDWKAVWIYKSGPILHNDFTFFRKKVIAKKPIHLAVLYLSAQNTCKFWLNGEQINSDVSPAPSHIYKSKYYLAYDITEKIRQGENILGCALHYLNDGGQNYMNGLPGFIMQAVLEYEDGTKEWWISDESWKTLKNTPYRSGLRCQQNRRISTVTEYNFNQESAHWLESGYNDLHWERAVLSGINSQAWTMAPQFIPESVIHEKIVPVPVSVQKAGYQVFDVGKIISGWVEIHVKGVSGIRLIIRYSEDLNRIGHVRHNVANEISHFYYDSCILSEDESLTFSADFSFKAFRYFEIVGYPELIQADQIHVVSVGTDISFHSSFLCSNDVLNQIYDACIQTQTNNALNQLVDCPHREQAQYVADSDLQAETLLYNFNGYPMLKKVLDDFQHAQFPDGRFPFVFPTNLENDEFRLNIPEWDLYYASLLWKTAVFYHDTNLLNRYYPTMQKAIAGFVNLLDEKTGLLARNTGWHISDWPYPDVDDENLKFLTVENCLLYYNLTTAKKIAKILNREQDAASYAKQAARLKMAICQHLYN
jgi:alpha-L-rhamnosidase